MNYHIITTILEDRGWVPVTGVTSSPPLSQIRMIMTCGIDLKS